MSLCASPNIHSESTQMSKREGLILEHLPLVKRIVARMAAPLPATIDVDELNTAGIIGLIQAVDRFDSAKGVKFSTFASYRIRGAILEELRAKDILNRSDRKKVKILEKTVLAFEQTNGREPTDDEIARRMKIKSDDVLQIKQISAVSLVSLDEIGYGDDQHKPQLIKFLIDGHIDSLSLTNLSELKQILAKTIQALKDR